MGYQVKSKKKLGLKEKNKVVSIPTKNIKPHPLNSSIYSSVRYGEDEELKLSIERDGLLEPLAVFKEGSNYTLLSGHRRFKVIQSLKWEYVDCRIIDNDFDVIKLIQFNKYREKTIIEKRSELRELKNYLKSLTQKQRSRLLEGVKFQDFIYNETGLNRQTNFHLDFVEENDKELFEDVSLGKISPSKAYEIVKSKLNGEDIQYDSTMSDVKRKIKSLSGVIPREKWIDLINDIYD